MDYALHMVYIRKNMHNFGYPGAPARGLFAGMEVTKQSTLRSWTATAVPGVPSPPNRHLVDRQIVARCGPRIGYPHGTSDRFGRFGRSIFSENSGSQRFQSQPFGGETAGKLQYVKII